MQMGVEAYRWKSAGLIVPAATCMCKYEFFDKLVRFFSSRSICLRTYWLVITITHRRSTCHVLGGFGQLQRLLFCVGCRKVTRRCTSLRCSVKARLSSYCCAVELTSTFLHSVLMFVYFNDILCCLHLLVILLHEFAEMETALSVKMDPGLYF